MMLTSETARHLKAKRAQAETINNPIVRAEKTPTRGNAIKAMCAHCFGCTAQHLEPGFRDAIRDCSAPQCPLHPWRPFQVKRS